MNKTIYDVIIIGAGPAGLTAAIYASRARMCTLLIESLSVPSQLTMAHWIENYPGFPNGVSGFDLLEEFRSQARYFGTEFTSPEVSGVRLIEKDGKPGFHVRSGDQEFESLSLIIASGRRFQKLGIPGEVKFLGRGVSYCAVCDGALFREKTLAVIGGGDTAVEEALFLTKFASKVLLVHRRDRLRATPILQERVFANKKIEPVWNSLAEEIKGETKVSHLLIKNVLTEEKREMLLDGVFISIGMVPNTDFMKDIVKFMDGDYILTNEKMAASQPGIFACGDCRMKGLKQVVTACGDGAQAEFSAQHYVDQLKGQEYK